MVIFSKCLLKSVSPITCTVYSIEPILKMLNLKGLINMKVSLFLSGTPFLVTKKRDPSPDLGKCEKEHENCGKDTFFHSLIQK